MIWCDNVSPRLLASNFVLHSRTKHMDLDVNFIRSQVAVGVLAVHYVSSEYQVVDILTKLLSAPRLCDLRRKLKVQSLVTNEEEWNSEVCDVYVVTVYMFALFSFLTSFLYD